MCYKLFEGNTNDCLTLKPMVQELQKNYEVVIFKKTIIYLTSMILF